MASGGRYSYGYYPATPSAAPQGGTAASSSSGRPSYPTIAPAGAYPPTGPAPYQRYRPAAPTGAPSTPWHSHRQYPTPTPQAPPARAPENMSSLTQYSVKVKDEFIFPPPVPAASIERVHPSTHELSTSLEDAILADAEARLRAASTSLPSGAADSLLGDLSTVAINSSHPGGDNDGGGTGSSILAARAPPPMPPMVDAAQPALEVYRDMNIGTPISRQLALAKYPGEDQETVEAFCRHFEKCKEVLHGKVTDRDIAAALYATDAENGTWQHSAMNLLMA